MTAKRSSGLLLKSSSPKQIPSLPNATRLTHQVHLVILKINRRKAVSQLTKKPIGLNHARWGWQIGWYAAGMLLNTRHKREKKMVPGRIDFLEKDAMSLYTNIVCLSRFSSSSQKSRGGHRPLGRTSRHTDHPKKWDDLTPSRSATFTSTYLQPRRKKKLIKNR
jgi:hypothetical protein